jgi:DNA oxidative demethylase
VGSVVLSSHARLLTGFARDQAPALLIALGDICEISPFRHIVTHGGRVVSVGMTNCGAAGWVTDRSGYRYDPIDPETSRAWPAMPALFATLAAEAAAAAGFGGFAPDACFINRYTPGTRLSLHQDRNERDFAQPIVPCR